MDIKRAHIHHTSDVAFYVIHNSIYVAYSGHVFSGVL